MQKLSQWVLSKGLPIVCLFIICVVFPATMFFWKTHPHAAQTVADTETDGADEYVLPDNSGPPPLPPGTKAVDFNSRTIDGTPYTFHCHSPNIKILDFWATWCGPCHMSIPGLIDLDHELKSSGVEIVGVACDDTDTVAQVKPTAEQLGMSYTVLADSQDNIATQETYNATGLPSVYIIDGKGIVRWSYTGYWQGEEQYIRQIISNLQAGKPVGLQ